MEDYTALEADLNTTSGTGRSRTAGFHSMLPFPSFSSSSSAVGDVNYSCGSCGYELNLSSCNRNTSPVGVEYRKKIKRGIISFFTIDETRFTQENKLQCLPYFTSKQSWGLFQRHTKLLCRNCGNYVGISYKERGGASSNPSKLVKSNSTTTTWDGISTCRTYDIRIRSLRLLLPSQDLALLLIDPQ